MRVILHLALLASLALLVFREGLSHQFTNWDDGQYIVENPLIRGLSWDRIVAAFTSFHVANYNPLHLVSYMVDHELWGLRAGGFFATGLLLHILTAFLVHEVARRWTGSVGAALFVAAVFLIHPTRVESVAWLSERKDLLSGLFGMGSLLAYMKHREASLDGKGRKALAASWILFLLALLSKTQVVTLPLVFVAVDLAGGRGLKSSLLGKVPFFVLSILFSVVTMAAAFADESTRGFELPGSILDPIAALPHYVLHILWPVGLSPYYGHSQREFHGALALSFGTLVLLVLGLLAWRSWRGRRIYLLGVVWFLALLAPVLGFVRVNIQIADRYLYLSILGPLLAVAWHLARIPRFRDVSIAGATAVVAALSLVSIAYLPAFRDSEALWNRVLAADPTSSMAHSSLGSYCLLGGRLEEAALHFDADLAERPYFEASLRGRALLHEAEGQPAEAQRLYVRLLERRPRSSGARVLYAEFLERIGDLPKGLEILLGLDPAYADGQYCQRVSEFLCRSGRRDEAHRWARRAVDVAPYDARSWHRLGMAESERGDVVGAEAAFEKALLFDSGLEPARVALAKLRDREKP